MENVQKRVSVHSESPIVVFIIGMRINSLWRVHRWLPVFLAMGRMLRELFANPDSGFLNVEYRTFSRSPLLIQYWRSFEDLERYAKDRESAHYPAWKQFNQAIRASGTVGIWHETYCVQAGMYENIYVNMPPTGLGKVVVPETVHTGINSARQRMQA
jgi:hypothetical protein